MTVLTQSYPLKLPQDITLRQQLDMLRDLALHAAQQLLEELWSDHWIDTLDTNSKKKAYKVIDEKRVTLTLQGAGGVSPLPYQAVYCRAGGTHPPFASHP